MKIRPVGAELFRADGQTDRHDDATSHHNHHHHLANMQFFHLLTPSGHTRLEVS